MIIVNILLSGIVGSAVAFFGSLFVAKRQIQAEEKRIRAGRAEAVVIALEVFSYSAYVTVREARIQIENAEKRYTEENNSEAKKVIAKEIDDRLREMFNEDAKNQYELRKKQAVVRLHVGPKTYDEIGKFSDALAAAVTEIDDLFKQKGVKNVHSAQEAPSFKKCNESIYKVYKLLQNYTETGKEEN